MILLEVLYFVLTFPFSTGKLFMKSRSDEELNFPG
jgi:hypothetical protein